MELQLNYLTITYYLHQSPGGRGGGGGVSLGTDMTSEEHQQQECEAVKRQQDVVWDSGGNTGLWGAVS